MSSRAKRRCFAAAAVALTLGILWILVEMGLSWRARQIAESNHLQPGFFRYHSQLGWALTPRFQARHRHHDFDVVYTTDSQGFRHDPNARLSERPWLILGDSFTFGLGVNDGETFVSLLNNHSPEPGLKNCAIPGYSTDQELILLESLLATNNSWAGVCLVVYVGNDLFDNILPFPLQASGAKPHYELKDGRLVLKHTPVPQVRKPPNAPSLASIVLGPDSTWLDPLINRSLILQSLRETGLFSPSPAEFQDRFDPYLQLFVELTAAIEALCRGRDLPFRLILLAGRSYVEQPRSISAACQQTLLSAIAAEAGQRGWMFLNAAAGLRSAHARGTPRLFHPNEGHLTPAGHKETAALVRASALFSPPPG